MNNFFRNEVGNIKKTFSFILILIILIEVRASVIWYFTEYNIGSGFSRDFIVFSDVWHDRDEQSIPASGRKYLNDLLNDGEWKNGRLNADYDAFFNCESDQRIYYASSQGVFYDITADKYLIISDEQRVTLNEYLGYITKYK